MKRSWETWRLEFAWMSVVGLKEVSEGIKENGLKRCLKKQWQKNFQEWWKTPPSSLRKPPNSKQINKNMLFRQNIQYKEINLKVSMRKDWLLHQERVRNTFNFFLATREGKRQLNDVLRKSNHPSKIVWPKKKKKTTTLFMIVQ